MKSRVLNGGIENLHTMYNTDRMAGTIQRRLQLHQASGIAGGYSIYAERFNQCCLPIAKRRGGSWLHEVVDSGGTATDWRLWNFRDFQFRYLRQQLAWLRAHALGMLEVTGVVICNLQRERMPL